MSNFLHHVLMRQQGQEGFVRPRPRALFEPTAYVATAPAWTHLDEADVDRVDDTVQAIPPNVPAPAIIPAPAPTAPRTSVQATDEPEPERASRRQDAPDVKPHTRSTITPMSPAPPGVLPMQAEDAHEPDSRRQDEGRPVERTPAPPTPYPDVSWVEPAGPAPAGRTLRPPSMPQPPSESSPEQGRPVASVPPKSAPAVILPAEAPAPPLPDETVEAPKATEHPLQTVMPVQPRRVQRPRRVPVEAPQADGVFSNLSKGSLLPAEPPSLGVPRPAALSASAELPSTTPPTIRVTIGRIEVKAVVPPPAAPTPQPQRVRPRRPALSLDDYLRQRNGQ